MLFETSRRWWMLVVALGTCWVLAGCNGQILLNIDVEDDGSGTIGVQVEADAEAADRILDLRGNSSLPLSDLADAQWDVSPPTRATDSCRLPSAEGCLVVLVEKEFGTPEQFAEIMEEVSGSESIFRDFELVRTQSFGSVEYSLNGLVDSTDGFDSFGDEQMAQALGRGVGSIVASEPYAAQPEDIAIEIDVRLPGEIQGGSSNGEDIDEDPSRTRAVWTTDLGTPRLNVSLLSARRSTSAQVLRGGAVVAGVVALLLVFGQALLAIGPMRRERPAEVKPRRADALGRSAEEAKAEEKAAQAASGVPEASEEEPRVVALDGPGVLYREGDDVRNLLIPFLRERGSRIPDRDVLEKARLLSLGRITTPDFWLMMGLPDDPNELDNAYVATHQLNHGVVRYLRALRKRNIKIACITNDAATWARRLQDAHNLDSLIDTWVVSGTVGVRKPDPALYEVLRRMTGEKASTILLIDDTLANLDEARVAGMATRWFTVDGDEADSRGHVIQRNFESAIKKLDESGIPSSEPGPPESSAETSEVSR